MKSAHVAAALLALVGCADDAAPPNPAPAPTPEPADSLERIDPDPNPPFDFRRAILWPERHRGETRTCIVASIVDAPDRDPGDPPEPPAVAAHHLRCELRGRVYEVRALVPEAQRDLELDPAPAPGVRRVSLRIVGVDESGRRPLAVLEASRVVAADDAPRAAPARPAAPAFDFGRAAAEPSLVGTRRSCAIRAATQLVRPAAADRPSPDALVTMPVTCGHEGGRSNVELLFDEEALEHALNASPGAIAHGVLETPRHLRVSHVTPPTR